MWYGVQKALTDLDSSMNFYESEFFIICSYVSSNVYKVSVDVLSYKKQIF